MKWIALLLIIVVIFVLAPWQALQTSWVIPPASELRIHWHKCLSAGGGSVTLTDSQMIGGFITENLSSSEPLIVKACK